MPWELTGNAGTNPATNFLGSTDGQPLVIQPDGGSVGVGTKTPSARLSVVLPNSSEIMGSAHSSALLTSSGALGPTAGNEMGLASFGLTVGNNNMSLGVRAIRTAGETGWHSTAIGLGMDVDNTVRAGAALFLHADGNVGIGTEAPSARLSVVLPNSSEIMGSAHSSALLTSSGALGPTPGNEMGLASFGLTVGNNNNMSLGVRAIRTAGETDWHSTAIGLGMDVDNTVRAGAALFLHANANVGIGTITPTEKLSVNGNVAVTGDVLLTGADCAEHFDVMGGQLLEPGTVVVIDQGGALGESQEAYDKKVAGVVSGAGEYRHALVLDKRPSEEGRIPVALVGKVYCKVDAQYASIGVGDLLTSSSTPGHAMKAIEPERTFGSVIGKALGRLEGGTGLIPILITLQ
jgi:hypothetical protein